MPCYIRAAQRLGVSIPQKTDPEKLEDNLRRELNVTSGKHEKLTEAINKKLKEDPEGLKKILVQAVAISAKKEEEKGPPDRLKKLAEKGDKVWQRVVEESAQQ